MHDKGKPNEITNPELKISNNWASYNSGLMKIKNCVNPFNSRVQAVRSESYLNFSTLNGARTYRL